MCRVNNASLYVLMLAAAGCHTRPPATAPTYTATSPAASSARSTPVPPPRLPDRSPEKALSEDDVFANKSLSELNAEHPLSDVFFAYNDNTLTDEARRVLQQDARWLARWSRTRIRIDGHCDERGTPEYNLALGDRRAQTVRAYLTSLGVPSSRIDTRSLGRESPFCQSSGESCWTQNRRGHFWITGK
jgi:peptidoglycan-associated lipoprotein